MRWSALPSRPTIVPVPSSANSDDAFAEVKAKVDLVKVVQEHVRLTKRNRELWGLCPFHQEDSPSFKVNPQMQSWYCFGCQRHGDVFTFVELIEKTDKRGALQTLAERAGVELRQLSPEQRERSDSRKRLLAMLKLAAQYYEYVLWSSPAGEPGRRLLVQRQVGEETARRFQLGYAPAGRGFAEYLRAKKRSLADAQAAGLMRRDGSDFFAERLLVFDADRAGQQAMRKAAVLVAQHGMRTRAATLPDGMDPDEFLRAAGAQAGERWQGVADSAPSSFEAGVAQDIAGFNPSNANQMEIVAGRLREWIGQFPEGLRDGYVEVAERRTGISRHLLLRGPEPKRELKQAPNGLSRQLVGKKTTVSRYLLQLLAVNPAAFDRIRTKLSPEELDDEDRGIYVRMLETYDRAGTSGLENELGGYPAEVQDLIRRAWAAPPPNVDGQVAEELVARLRLDRMKGRHSGIIRELSEAERGREAERVARLEAEARELARAINDMERSS